MWKRLLALVSAYLTYLIFGTTIYLLLEANNEKIMRNATLNSSALRSYGNVAPSTTIGQICTIIYGLLGIPLHIVLMMLLGNEFKHRLERIEYWAMERCPHFKWSVVIRTIFTIFGIFIFIIASAIIFIYTEGWTFLGGLYYSFITLATVGLGDYIAGNSVLEYRFYWIYLLFLLFWVIFGLAFLTFLFGVVYGWMHKMLNALTIWCNKFDVATGKKFDESSTTIGIQPRTEAIISQVENATSSIITSVFDRNKPDADLRRKVLHLTENDEVTEEDLAVLDKIIEELEEEAQKATKI